ncbi:hypothetical protein C5167_041398 [Papaver somniferum]|nr:hypothetical protein C5167_041398 [Papaver somniferum]
MSKAQGILIFLGKVRSQSNFGTSDAASPHVFGSKRKRRWCSSYCCQWGLSCFAGMSMWECE